MRIIDQPPETQLAKPAKGRAVAAPGKSGKQLKVIERALAVFDQPGDVVSCLNVAKRIEAMEFRTFDFRRDIARAANERNQWLPLFEAADTAHHALLQMHGSPPWPENRVKRDEALVMVNALLGALGGKPDRDILLGMVDVLESGDIASVTWTLGDLAGDGAAKPQWTALYVSGVSLALACRKLMATCEPFGQLKPAQLYTACQWADRTLSLARQGCGELVDWVQRCDVLLLEFDRAEWRRPYLNLQYRPLLQRMLELHELQGNGSGEWDDHDEDDNPLHPLRILIKDKLEKVARAKIAAE